MEGTPSDSVTFNKKQSGEKLTDNPSVGSRAEYKNNIDTILSRPGDFSEEKFSALGDNLSKLEKIDKKLFDSYEEKCKQYFEKVKVAFTSKSDKQKKESIEMYKKKVEGLYILTQTDDSFFAALRQNDMALGAFLSKYPEKTEKYIEEQIKNLASPNDFKTIWVDKPIITKFVDGKEVYNGNIYYSVLSTLPIADSTVFVEGEGNQRVYKKKFGNETFRFEPWLDPQREFISIVSEDNKQKVIVMSLPGLLSKLEHNQFDQIVQKMEENFKQETDKRHILERFDLPKDQKISYMRVFPKDYDATIQETVMSAMTFANVLENHYPNLQIEPLLFTNDPISELQKNIEEGYKNGGRYFYLDIYNHGSQSEIAFEKHLTADGLTTLINQFPEAKFVVSTIACFGGGLREDFLKILAEHPDLKNRVNLFLQTKPDVPTPTGMIVKKNKDNIPKIADYFSSYYYLYLMKALMSGKTYGEAHLEADQKTKEQIYSDPEALINGELITRGPTSFPNAPS